jgi:uncharacterized protein involved in outer membrane biogenesis
MRRLVRWVFRIVLGLVLLAIVLVVAAIILLDTMAKELVVNRLRSRTGMEAKVTSVHVGLLSPTISIEGLKLYNTADFGGAVCLDMPELHLVYDASALRSRQLHITLLRLEILELSVVASKSGRSNFEIWKQKSRESSKNKSAAERLKFTSIDVLNVTLGKIHLANQATGHGEEIDFGHKTQILRNVKTGADLSSLGLFALLQSKTTSSGDADVDLNQVLDSLFK